MMPVVTPARLQEFSLELATAVVQEFRDQPGALINALHKLQETFGYVDEAVDYAVKLGVALQLTNILRDIGEDANRGRIYIPQQDLQRYGLTDEDIFQRRRTPQFKAMLRFQSARAHALYEAAWPGVGMLNPDSSLAIAAAATIYRGILDSIHSADYDVFTKRAYVPLVRKVGLLIGAYARLKRDFQ